MWIGGAVCEVDRLRRATGSTADQDSVWAGLARLAGYDSVAIDVLAGASAGGLNAALLTASLVYGQSFERTRRMWVRLADIEAMARKTPAFWQPRPDSLLEGDDYFRRELVEVLAEGGSGPGGAPGRVDLLLTATLLDPAVVRYFDAGTTRCWSSAVEPCSGSGTSAPGDPLSDFGTGEQFQESVLRLAHAARTTSSYPFAFEPAQVHSAPGKPPAGEPNMLGFFSESSASPQAVPFRVVDGGVLDNIPVTAAVKAIAEAPADRPTDRWLLYLNPDPAVSRGQRPSRVVDPGRRSRGAGPVQPGVPADRHQGVGRAQPGRRTRPAAPAGDLRPVHSAIPVTGPRCWPSRLALPRWRTPGARRAGRAGGAPVAHRAGRGGGRHAPPTGGWGSAARLVRRGPVAPAGTIGPGADRGGRPGAVRGRPRAARRGARMPRLGLGHRAVRCGSLAGQLQSRAVPAAGAGRGAGEHADRYWVTGAGPSRSWTSGRLDGWIQRMLHRRRRLQHHLPSPVGPLLGAVLQPWRPGRTSSGSWRTLPRTAVHRGVVRGGRRSGRSGVDAVAAAWQVLERIADRLAGAAPRRTREPDVLQVGYAVLEDSERRGGCSGNW